MRFGVTLNIASEPGCSDAEAINRHLSLAILAEQLSFDSLFALEHHFTDYVLSPSPLQLLTFFAGRTSHLQLGTAVIVLPWNDPVRVAEQISMLDILSHGGSLYAFGRGRADIEFQGFRVPKAESRARFIEASEIVLGLLTHDAFAYDGKYFQIPKLSLRPRSNLRPVERFFGAATSPESVAITAQLGFGLLLSTDKSHMELGLDVAAYNSASTVAGHIPKPPIILASVSVASTRDRATENALEYLGRELELSTAHYHSSADSLWPRVPAAETSDMRCTASVSATHNAVEAHVRRQLVGTPDDCIQQILELRRHTGLDHLVLEFSYGGMPYITAKENMTLFARHVLPVCRSALNLRSDTAS